MPIQFKTLKNITLAVSGATTFAAGQLLKITFETPAQTKKISLAFERRRKDDKVCGDFFFFLYFLLNISFPK